MQDYRKIEVWQKAHQLALDLYRCTEAFPKREQYNLTDQIRRAVISIPANIAEGCAKSTSADFARYLDIASGSASEVDYLLLFSKDLSWLSQEEYRLRSEELISIRKMLTSLRNKVKSSTTALHKD
jgi:four helix bundle protein